MSTSVPVEGHARIFGPVPFVVRQPVVGIGVDQADQPLFGGQGDLDLFLAGVGIAGTDSVAAEVGEGQRDIDLGRLVLVRDAVLRGQVVGQQPPLFERFQEQLAAARVPPGRAVCRGPAIRGPAVGEIDTTKSGRSHGKHSCCEVTLACKSSHQASHRSLQSRRDPPDCRSGAKARCRGSGAAAVRRHSPLRSSRLQATAAKSQRTAQKNSQARVPWAMQVRAAAGPDWQCAHHGMAMRICGTSYRELRWRRTQQPRLVVHRLAGTAVGRPPKRRSGPVATFTVLGVGRRSRRAPATRTYAADGRHCSWPPS